MAGGMAGSGMVGDLVAAQSSCGQPCTGVGHQAHRQVFLRQVQLRPLSPAGKHRAWLNGQVIDREMRGLTADGLVQLVVPVLKGLTRQVLNQIKTPALQIPVLMGRMHPAAGLQQISPSMTPAEVDQNSIIKTLATQADAVHPRSKHRHELGLIKAGGIHLKGDFRTRLQTELSTQGRQQFGDLIRCQQGGSATTDVDRRQGRTACGGGDLAMKQPQVILNGAAAGALPCVHAIPQRNHSEIAVVTTTMAKRNVEIGAAGRWWIGHAANVRPELPRPEPMVDLLILLLFVGSGAAAGWLGIHLLPEQLVNPNTDAEQLRLILTAAGGGAGLLAGLVFKRLRVRLMQQVRTMPTDLLVSRAVGLILGLLVANLLLLPVLLLPFAGSVVLLKPLLAVVSNVFFGILGSNLAEVHGRTLLRLLNPASTEALLVADGVLTPATAKILDTSVIIDGRIRGMLACGLLEGQVIVAETVISEMQQLSDSTNIEKRAKGRRGLKLLKDLRETYGRRLVINSTRYDGNGTDDRLLQLADDTGGTLVTADFNLAQVASVKNLKVMNLSELVIALRPEVQPGDELNLKIVREGKEESQGVGYLDDGTMVVVNDAKPLIGQRKPVVVTGALQTPTGRMVFARLGTGTAAAGSKGKSKGKPSKANNPKAEDPR